MPERDRVGNDIVTCVTDRSQLCCCLGRLEKVFQERSAAALSLLDGQTSFLSPHRSCTHPLSPSLDEINTDRLSKLSISSSPDFLQACLSEKTPDTRVSLAFIWLFCTQKNLQLLRSSRDELHRRKSAFLALFRPPAIPSQRHLPPKVPPTSLSIQPPKRPKKEVIANLHSSPSSITAKMSFSSSQSNKTKSSPAVYANTDASSLSSTTSLLHEQKKKSSSTSGGSSSSSGGGNARVSSSAATAAEQKMIKDAQMIGQIMEKYPGTGM